MCPGNLETPYFPVKGICFGGFPLKFFQFELRKYVFLTQKTELVKKGLKKCTILPALSPWLCWFNRAGI